MEHRGHFSPHLHTKFPVQCSILDDMGSIRKFLLSPFCEENCLPRSIYPRTTKRKRTCDTIERNFAYEVHNTKRNDNAIIAMLSLSKYSPEE